MSSVMVRLSLIVNLKVKAMLHEIALLLRTPGHFDTPVVDIEVTWFESRRNCHFPHSHCLGSAVSSGAKAHLGGGADVADFPDAVVAVVVGHSVRVGNAARGFAE